MDDPVLDALEDIDAKHVYLLNGAEPISLRDQTLRGAVLVRRLIAKKILDPKDPKARLLVVGAGACGVTAALVAERRGIHTLLVERNFRPFGLQRRAPHRHVEPTLYDWPVDHWDKGVIPWSTQHAKLPLRFCGNSTGSHVTARSLALDWERELSRVRKRSKFLTVAYNIEAVPPQADPGVGTDLVPVEFQSYPPTEVPAHLVPPPGLFNAVIWSIGFGRENCRVPSFKNFKYEGEPFWGPASFLRSGLPNNPRVLISGAGDGALQDYLNVVTDCPSAEELYRACVANILPKSVIKVHLSTLQSAEERAQRGRSWAYARNIAGSEISYLRELQAIHQSVVDEILKDDDVKAALKVSTDISKLERVCLAYRGPWITANYGLNRFMVLLIATYLKEIEGIQTLSPLTTISDVNSNQAGHTCLKPSTDYTDISNPKTTFIMNAKQDPEGFPYEHECYGKSHMVTLKCNGMRQDPEEFNVIIIRHGKEFKVPLRHPRRLWLFHLPNR